MSADILAQLADLPPGLDIFPIVRAAINAEVGSMPSTSAANYTDIDSSGLSRFSYRFLGRRLSIRRDMCHHYAHSHERTLHQISAVLVKVVDRGRSCLATGS